jgi:hypothetical protein
MQWTTVATIGAVLAAALVTGCAAATASADVAARHQAAALATTSASTAGNDSCYSFAVSALRRHIVVRNRPPACAGLPQALVNEDVARAIRTVVGPHPKAVERRLAVAESRYLGSLVHAVRPPPAVSLVAVPAAASSGEPALRFAALLAWLAAALAGTYLLAGLLTRHWLPRVIRKPRSLAVAPLIHAGLAIAGLLIWIAFTVTTAAALAWTDVGLTWVIAGLGMATLLGGPDQQANSGMASAARDGSAGMTAAAFPSRAPVVVIAIHGVLATLTILLVLLAAVGIG